MPLNFDDIAKILDLIKILDPKESMRLSMVATRINLNITSIIKAADILGFRYECNPNTKIRSSELVLILNSLVENSEYFDKYEMGKNHSYRDIVLRIQSTVKNDPYLTDTNFLESKIFKSYSPVFKYQPFNDNTISSLNGHYIYHSKVADFNDPFDCNAKLVSKIMQKKSYPIDPGVSLNDLVKCVGISCFSKTNSSILMWSHYANKHSGVCIEYSSYELNDRTLKYSTDSNDAFHKGLLKNTSVFFNKIYEVEYREQLNQHTAISSKKGFFNTANKLFLSKFADWKYEQEVRRIIYINTPDNHDERKFYHSPNLIKAIYIGVLASDYTIKTVRSIVKDHYNNKVKLYKAILSTNIFGVEFEPLDHRL